MADDDIQVSYEVELMVHGYHCYSTIWNAVTGEELPCKLELSNPEERFAVEASVSASVSCRLEEYRRFTHHYCGEKG